jgi:hypothetical protein
MIEYDGSFSRERQWLKDDLNKSGIKSYFDAFYFVRNQVLDRNLRSEFPTYKSIQDFIINANFNRSSDKKLSSGVWETIWFNVKMYRVHLDSWEVWDPNDEYFKKFQTRGELL